MANVLIWIDDERPAPNGFTHWAKTSAEAIEILQALSQEDVLVLVSFDHDLSMDPTDGHPLMDDGQPYDDVRPVINWMIENNVFPELAVIHTMNREGGDWIQRSLTHDGPESMRVLRLPFNRKNYS